MKRLTVIAGVLLLLAGLGLFLAPDLYSLYFARQSKSIVSVFREMHRSTSQDTSAPDNEDSSQYEATLERFQAYNVQIYADKQSELADAWSYEQPPFEGLEAGEVFGAISIPAMEVELPLYLGATTENLSCGAAVLGQTSVPIGGENTNAVIAGHRGYHGAPYFREIEKLKPGDTVTIENPWETLTYAVSEIKVIRPDDLSAVCIQEGRDMITLVTCHPYRSGGKYRYLVYCDRTGTIPRVQESAETIPEASSAEMEEIPLESSEEDIHSEQILRLGCAAILILLILAALSSRTSEN